MLQAVLDSDQQRSAAIVCTRTCWCYAILDRRVAVTKYISILIQYDTKSSKTHGHLLVPAKPHLVLFAGRVNEMSYTAATTSATGLTIVPEQLSHCVKIIKKHRSARFKA